MTNRPKFVSPSPMELNEILRQARAARSVALAQAVSGLFRRLRGLFGQPNGRRTA